MALLYICALREKCPCSEFFWSVFSLIQTEYEEILRIFPHPVRLRKNSVPMWEKTDQKNFKYGHFFRSGDGLIFAKIKVLKIKNG